MPSGTPSELVVDERAEKEYQEREPRGDPRCLCVDHAERERCVAPSTKLVGEAATAEEAAAASVEPQPDTARSTQPHAEPSTALGEAATAEEGAAASVEPKPVAARST